jgi:hypothetical protein
MRVGGVEAFPGVCKLGDFLLQELDGAFQFLLRRLLEILVRRPAGVGIA